MQLQVVGGALFAQAYFTFSVAHSGAKYRGWSRNTDDRVQSECVCVSHTATAWPECECVYIERFEPFRTSKVGTRRPTHWKWLAFIAFRHWYLCSRFEHEFTSLHFHRINVYLLCVCEIVFSFSFFVLVSSFFRFCCFPFSFWHSVVVKWTQIPSPSMTHGCLNSRFPMNVMSKWILVGKWSKLCRNMRRTYTKHTSSALRFYRFLRAHHHLCSVLCALCNGETDKLNISVFGVMWERRRT